MVFNIGKFSKYFLNGEELVYLSAYVMCGAQE